MSQDHCNTADAVLSPEVQALIAQYVQLHGQIARAWADIKAAQALGFRCELGADIAADGECQHTPSDPGTDGLGPRKLLRIKGGLGSAQTARALAHELGHALLHGQTADGITRDKACRELEADSCAYIVCAHFGLDCSAPCAAYLASFAGKQAREALKALAGRVQGAAAKIIAQTEIALTPYAKRAELNAAGRAA